MRFLTGAPTRSYYKDYDYKDAETAWNEISTADPKNFILFAGTPGKSDTETVANGLAASHAYTILSVHTVKNKDLSVKAKLYLMRNPWGKDGEYKGTWNDNDALWLDTTNNYKGQVPYTKNTADGLFFISHTDFFTYFAGFSVSYQNDKYISSTSTVEGDKGDWTEFHFTLNDDVADGFMGIDFYTPRMYPKGCKIVAGSNPPTK
jgi:hypothetical protein